MTGDCHAQICGSRELQRSRPPALLGPRYPTTPSPCGPFAVHFGCPCGPFAVPVPSAANTREHPRTASHEPSVFAPFRPHSRIFAVLNGNRGAQIRTGDLTDPNGARYQAAPRPDAGPSIPHRAASPDLRRRDSIAHALAGPTPRASRPTPWVGSPPRRWSHRRSRPTCPPRRNPRSPQLLHSVGPVPCTRSGPCAAPPGPRPTPSALRPLSSPRAHPAAGHRDRARPPAGTRALR